MSMFQRAAVCTAVAAMLVAQGAASQAPETWQVDFLDQLEALLGADERLATESRLVAVDEVLRPRLALLPKDARGGISTPAAVNAMHEYLVQNDGSQLSAAGDEPRPSSSAFAICEHVPPRVCDLFYRYLDSDSLDSDEVVLLAAATGALREGGRATVAQTPSVCDALGKSLHPDRGEQEAAQAERGLVLAPANKTFDTMPPEPFLDKNWTEEAEASGGRRDGKVEGNKVEANDKTCSALPPAVDEARDGSKEEACGAGEQAAQEHDFRWPDVSEVMRCIAFAVALGSSSKIIFGFASEIFEDRDTFRAALGLPAAPARRIAPSSEARTVRI